MPTAELDVFFIFPLSRNVARHVGIFLCGNSNFTSDGPIAHITQHLKVQKMAVTDISALRIPTSYNHGQKPSEKDRGVTVSFLPTLAGLSQNPKAYRAACSTAAFCSVAAVFFPFLGDPIPLKWVSTGCQECWRQSLKGYTHRKACPWTQACK